MEPRFPDLSFDARGNAILVWSAPDSTSYEHFARRYVAGSGWGTIHEFHAPTNPTSFNKYSAVTLNDQGEAAVLWTQFDGTRDNLWALHFR